MVQLTHAQSLYVALLGFTILEIEPILLYASQSISIKDP